MAITETGKLVLRQRIVTAKFDFIFRDTVALNYEVEDNKYIRVFHPVHTNVCIQVEPKDILLKCPEKNQK